MAVGPDREQRYSRDAELLRRRRLDPAEPPVTLADREAEGGVERRTARSGPALGQQPVDPLRLHPRPADHEDGVPGAVRELVQSGGGAIGQEGRGRVGKQPAGGRAFARLAKTTGEPA